MMPDLAPIKVLIVDDDELLCQLIASFVTDRGCEALCAFDFGHAVELFETERPDVALLDYTLPEGNGLSLLQTLRELNHQQWFPALIISGHEDKSFIQACFEGGADDYIVKPFDFLLLDAKIKAMARIAEMQKNIVQQAAELQLYYEFTEAENQYAHYLYERLVAHDTQAPGVTRWVQASTRFSGDVVLFERGKNGDLYFLLADATGHGLAAAISLIPLIQVFSAMSTKGFQLPFIVAEMNRALRRFTPGDRFVAALVGQASHAHDSLSVWNGGIPPALWLDAEGRLLRQLKSHHLPLGVLRPEEFEGDVESWPCKESGILLCHSDGVHEAQAPDGEFFGYERLHQCIEGPVAQLLTRLRASLDAHTQGQYADDVSIAMLDFARIFTESDAAPASTGALIPPCEWGLTHTGRQLGEMDLVPLCLHWFQSLGVSENLTARLFTVLSELVTNAIDHGVLGLSSELKEQPEGFLRYLGLREEKLHALPESARISVKLRLDQADGRQRIRLEVEDSGAGFDYSREATESSRSGRGIALVRRMADSVDYRGKGNHVVVTLSPNH
ncbi:MAG: SpoIIE family protein phosphatase [Gammaproteobacteria bacterium]|nr:SpoIIE family protein phosphatase [Gammaproteobacteria bacterium]